jgi:hypothetical protein
VKKKLRFPNGIPRAKRERPLAERLLLSIIDSLTDGDPFVNIEIGGPTPNTITVTWTTDEESA